MSVPAVEPARGRPVGGQRAGAVLSRFPAYLEATDPGKRLGAVVTALATGLDVLTRQVQEVRASRRVGEAPTTGDLLALAALHGLSGAAVAVLERRVAALAGAAATEPLDTGALAEQVNVPVRVLDGLAADRPDALADALADALRHRRLMPRRREAVLGAVTAHADGNATATGLLLAAAAYTGLRVLAVRHSPDRWWHLATCEDTARLAVAPAEDGGPAPDVAPLPEVVALEENPFRDADVEPAAKRHGQRTRILRGGLEDVDVTLRIVGVAGRTVRPMVVHLGTGTGIVFEGFVPDGEVLAFGATGRVTLSGADVTGSAWTFTGAVFADAGQALAADDFLLADDAGALPAQAGPVQRLATFAVPAPVGTALDLPSGLPHGAAAAGPLRLPRGESRWTVLVRTARTGGVEGPPVPRPLAGRFDEAVLGSDDGVLADPSLLLGFAWEEREPFAVRVLLPQRLSAADDDAGSLLREPLRRLLDRHRAAGVELRVEYADPRWTLGEGVLRQEEDEAVGVVIAGTALWPDSTAPDEPDP